MDRADVERSMVWSLEGKSHLTPVAMSVLGMADPFTRHLINNVSRGGSYLEVGSLLGATAIAAGCNRDTDVTAVDNFSYWTCVPTVDDEMNPLWGDDQEVRGYGMKAAWEAQVCKAGLRVTLVEEDFNEWTPSRPVDVVYYDGDHSEEATERGLRRIARYLQPRLLIVDDFFGKTVQAGVRAAELMVEKEWFLKVRNGIWVALLEC